MTRPLSPTSSRRLAAKRFGAELDRAMRTRGVGRDRLAAAALVTTSQIANFKAGVNLPRTDTAVRIAEALHWPKLAEISREGRSGACETCGRTFINEGGGAKRFCSPECVEIKAQMRSPAPGTQLVRTVKAALERPGAIRRAELAAAIATYDTSESKRVLRVDKAAQRLAVVQAAVDAMCRSCEPEGLCRTTECALRSVSPLPLPLDAERVAGEVRPAGTSWDADNRPKTLAAIQAANRERWDREGERGRMAQQAAGYFAAMTPEERAAHGAKVSAGRRRQLERTA